MSEPIISTAPQGAPASDSSDPVRALVAHADDNLVLAQRLGEWISRAPELEEDIALGNIALDHLGVARALYTHAGQLEGKERTEDDFAMRRPEREFLNVLLVEQRNGDFAHTMVRGLLFDAYQVELWADLSGAEDSTLAGIAGRALKEARYHLLHTSSWVIRLGDGTEESHRRAQAAVDALWRYIGELFEGVGSEYHDIWQKVVGETLDEARLQIPDDPYQRSGGRRGFHSEHLGPLLAEMQWMQRSHPGAGMVIAIAVLDVDRAREVASRVVDPEIPVLTIADLGILRGVRADGQRVVATITPTYSGCPAMLQIAADLRFALGAAGFEDVDVAIAHDPPWSSDWITKEGLEKLSGFGIAPPGGEIVCPKCRSGSARVVSRFGSTACKALMACTSCGEPFDHFKEF